MRYNPWEKDKPPSTYRPYKKRDRPTLKTCFKKKVEGSREERRRENQEAKRRTNDKVAGLV
jgi:hypothetical protein